MKLNLFGRRITMEIEKERTQTTEQKEIVKKAQETIVKYNSYLDPFKKRMIDNEEWYKSRHWEIIRNDKFKNDPEPTTAYVLNTIENKHADAMDFYPKANVLPRSSDDVDEAKRITEILPVEFEWNNFKTTWSKAWYDKLKLGSAIYAVLFDPKGADGIGANIIKIVDPVNFYCNPFVENLNESKWVFTSELIDVETFKELYPDADFERAGKLFEPIKYRTAENEDTSEQILIIDGYYLKTNDLGKKVVHFLKFTGNELLYWSEENEATQNGWYECDEYPFKIDTMYYEKGNIFGFGIIDVIKSPQVYVDKLDQIILANTFGSSRTKYAVQKGIGANIKDLVDPSKLVVEFEGLINESNFKELKTEPTDSAVFNHRKSKIEELKDTSSANEFARGEANGGVTAAQAIVALQKSSGKTSRDMITSSYSIFSELVYIYIEHMRQFYDMPRDYRVREGYGLNSFKFVSFNNSKIKIQSEPGINGKTASRKPVFDFKVEPEKQDPFSQAAQEEKAKDFFTIGALNPESFMQTKAMLQMMEFPGKEELLKTLEENAQIKQQLVMAQQAMIENQKLKLILQSFTGEDLGAQVNEQGGNQNVNTM